MSTKKNVKTGGEVFMFKDLNIPKDLIPSDPRFGVGPSLIPSSYLESLLKTGPHFLGTSHRQENVMRVVREIQEGLRSYFKLPDSYDIILGNGGATYLFDMIGLGLVKKKSAHFTNGEFSHKWYEAHKNIPWIEATEFKEEAGHGNDPKKIDGFDFVCGTLNETSTGAMISNLPDYSDTDTLLAIDATSGAGQIPCDIKKVDLYFFSVQKVFSSEGGLYVLFMSEKAKKRVEEIRSLDRYIPASMNLKSALDYSKKNQTYNTPSLTSLYFLNEQVKAMNAFGGEEKVVELARKKADLIYSWAKKKPYLEPFIKEDKFKSLSVATIDVDSKFKVSDFTKYLRDEKIIYDIDGYRGLGRNQLRISLFHNIDFKDLEKLTKIIDYCYEKIVR